MANVVPAWTSKLLLIEVNGQIAGLQELEIMHEEHALGQCLMMKKDL